MLRSAYLKAEPFLFRGLTPLMKRTRFQRSILAQRYLRGVGAEIGAFESPTLTPKGSSVRYIDRVPASHWRNIPEYRDLKLIEPDILDDGASLSSVPDASFDYLVAAHVLEHVEDPIAALKNWKRVVKPGGTLLVIVPDMRFTFDRERPLTTIEHLFRDHEQGPDVSWQEHYRDVGTNCLHLSGDDLEAFIAKREPAIHFHTFTTESFIRLLLALEFEIIETGLNVCEDYAVIRCR